LIRRAPFSIQIWAPSLYPLPIYQKLFATTLTLPTFPNFLHYRLHHAPLSTTASVRIVLGLRIMGKEDYGCLQTSAPSPRLYQDRRWPLAAALDACWYLNLLTRLSGWRLVEKYWLYDTFLISLPYWDSGYKWWEVEKEVQTTFWLEKLDRWGRGGNREVVLWPTKRLCIWWRVCTIGDIWRISIRTGWNILTRIRGYSHIWESSIYITEEDSETWYPSKRYKAYFSSTYVHFSYFSDGFNHHSLNTLFVQQTVTTRITPYIMHHYGLCW